MRFGRRVEILPLDGLRELELQGRLQVVFLERILEVNDGVLPRRHAAVAFRANDVVDRQHGKAELLFHLRIVERAWLLERCVEEWRRRGEKVLGEDMEDMLRV